ncbi:xanthine dehydrogenase family protein molybdopterin-binding subunit [Zunongwangia sp. F363]|uniref:Xanthine dehydrogenase family protein molybdopterin-binding subunit n=1 Tax=Autumnicola tepida TaxID=3075595 RepID=A0ABU3C8M7_9FLAO|nr:xanthine dehydrogenase family protein molybdopterin-binding subunit [Zunongwangia sp. F363]MDT0642674.1 xanthine dehydrogenase family protein molybdopterin-binding subunit [Zunongwangia sp. F363]
MIGEARNRMHGLDKVSGKAKYALEYEVDKPLYAIMVKSHISSGTIENIDESSIQDIPGIEMLIHSGNALKLNSTKKPSEGNPDVESEEISREPLADKKVYFAGQDIAIVVASNIEDAQLGASRLKVTYKKGEGRTDRSSVLKDYYEPRPEELQYSRGDFETAKNEADVVISEEYEIPTEHHNPMELSATTAIWDGDRLTVYDATQGVSNHQEGIARAFGLEPKNVRVIAQHIGGGFGCKGTLWPHTLLTAMAAKMTGRPVKMFLTREDMFTSVGHRPKVIQKVTLAADKNGKLEAGAHDTYSYTSKVGTFYESCGVTSAMLYDIPNFSMKHRYGRLNLPTPTYMRGPGESSGTYALEAAMDEMAEKLNMDPVEFRIINDTDRDLKKDLPFSSKHLKECYRRGAQLFGWENRNKNPGKMLKDGVLVGHGMATSTYPAHRSGGECNLTLRKDGTVLLRTATQDIGTGTYTVLGQIVADTLGVPFEKVIVEIGDSDYPKGPLSGGSQVTASAGSYVQLAAEKLRKKLGSTAIGQSESPYFQINENELQFENGKISDGSSEGENIENIVQRSGEENISVTYSTDETGAKQEEGYAYQSFGAVFVEANVDPDLGIITIPRITAVYDVGKVINRKLGNSQFYGGIIFGYGMGLLEHTKYDHGHVVNADLAEYYVPVNADINDLQVEYLDIPDYKFSSHGGRGIGEIGTTGVAAAIANAIYNATGKRIRKLPITLDKLI